MLRKALFLTVATTKDRARARKSRFFWSWDQDRLCWRLRVIGVLNGLLRSTGVVVSVESGLSGAK